MGPAVQGARATARDWEDQHRLARSGSARSLLNRPTVDAPGVRAAPFGPGTFRPFGRVLDCAALQRRYMPPGLSPQAPTGTTRVRGPGEDARFPEERALRPFLLRTGE